MPRRSGRRDAAHVDGRRAGLRRQERHRRQLLGIVFEVGDVQLIEPARPDRLNADRHVLQVFFALGRGDDDLGLVRDAAVLSLFHGRRRRSDVGGVGSRRRRLAGVLRRAPWANAGEANAVVARSPSVSARNERSVIECPHSARCRHCDRAAADCQRLAGDAIDDYYATVAFRSRARPDRHRELARALP